MVPDKYHIMIINSLSHFKNALFSCGINDTISLNNFVCSIEALQTEERNIEITEKLKRTLSKCEAIYSEEESNFIINQIKNSGVKKAFVDFVIEHSKGWSGFVLTEENDSRRLNLVEDSIYGLKKNLSKIYDYRSKFLHTGEEIPLDYPSYDDNNHFSIHVGKVQDNRTYLEKEKIPFLNITANLFKYSIMNYIYRNIKK